MKLGVAFFVVVIAITVLAVIYMPFINKSSAMSKLSSPYQKMLATPVVFSIKGFKLEGVAQFNLKAHILGIKEYKNDNKSAIAPMDMVAGWGLMSNPETLKFLRITQNNRQYHWFSSSRHLLRQDIETNSANIHIIPANPDIKNLLLQSQPGQTVQLKGYLVNVYGNSLQWKTSLTREDTGEGACEIFYIKSARILLD